MDMKERWEIIWLSIVLFLFAIVIYTTAQPIFNEVGGTQNQLQQIPSNARIINLALYAGQYYFKVYEKGEINSIMNLNNNIINYYYNVIIGKPSYWLNITMSSLDVTHNLYIPIYNGKVINVQILPNNQQYAVLQLPNLPGVYTFLGGEYSGPWFPYETGVIIVLPNDGKYYNSNDINQYISQTNLAKTNALVGDPYNPPIIKLDSLQNPIIYLLGNDYGMFNNSVPGPTVIVKKNSNVIIVMKIPVPNNDHNYLLNYTNGKPTPVKDIMIGIYAIWWNGTISVVKEIPISYNKELILNFEARAPAYLYGLITPIYYVYNVDNMSNLFNGIQKGYLTGLWGVILVEG
jgi:terminal oxidase subunit